MQFNNIGYDKQGIISFMIDDKICHNPFEIALQAIIGDNVLDAYSNVTGILVPRYISLKDLENPIEDVVAKRAMSWLLDNYTEIENAYIWNYDYDGIYEKTELKAPWQSAYGQAYCILAMVQWARFTEAVEYKSLAENAIRGLLLPIENGGCMITMKKGIWFEEITKGEFTHIFNAQLISLIALIEAKNYLQFDWVEEYINQGLLAFYQHAHHMDTGINSAYDMKKEYDCALQLAPADSGKLISIKEITVVDTSGKRTLNLADSKSFELGEQWIAGIDWSVEDEDGYRTLLNGESIHPIPLQGGDRQNTYVYFKNVAAQKDYFTLNIKYKATEATQLRLNKNCGEGGFVPLGYSSEISLMKGINEVSVQIPCVSIAPHVPSIYHKYHIQLLERLNELIPKFKSKYLIYKFQKYNELYKNRYVFSIPKLTGLAISVNEQCGLRCKMCDIGIRNMQSSMYYHMKNSMENQTLDVEMLIKRCEEIKEQLEVVQIIGTEPTLYADLPLVVEKLSKMGIRTFVTTNGINLKNMLKPLIAAGLKELYISIDGPSDIHDEIRGKLGLFHDIMSVVEEHKDLILEAEKDGFVLGLGVAITPMNYKHLDRLVKAVQGGIIKSIWCTHMNYITENIANEHTAKIPQYPISASCTDEEMNPLTVNPWLMYKNINSAKKMAEENGINFICVPALDDYMELQHFYHYPQVSVSRVKCDAPYRTLQINSNGDVCVMSRCYQFHIGSIYDSSLNDLFYSKPLMDLRENLRGGGLWDPCKRCCAIM